MTTNTLLCFRPEFTDGSTDLVVITIPEKTQEIDLVSTILEDIYTTCGIERVRDLVALRLTNQIVGGEYSTEPLPYMKGRKGKYTFSDIDEDGRYWIKLKTEFLDKKVII